MARKPALPNIDEEALGALARQFPSTVVSALRERAAAPASKPPAEPSASSPKDTSPPEPSPSPAAQASPPEPSPSPAAAPKRGSRALAGLALMTALLALGVAATAVLPGPARVWIKQRVADPAVADALTGGRARLDAAMAADAAALKTLETQAAASEARLAAIEAVGGSSNAAARRIDGVEAGVRAADARIATNEAAGTAAAGQIDKLSSAVAGLDAELKAAETRIAGAEADAKRAEAATNDALKPRLAAVEGGVASAARGSRVARFLFACLELRRAAQSSRPFERELAAAQSVADDNPDLAAALKTLSGYAAIGAPTAADLRDDFSLVVAPRVLAVSGVGQQGIAERTLTWVTSWFTASGPLTPGERNAALVQQALRDLQRDQLAAAVEQVLLLEDQSALIAANWLRTASSRLAVDKAVTTVMAQGFDRLAGSTR